MIGILENGTTSNLSVSQLYYTSPDSDIISVIDYIAFFMGTVSHITANEEYVKVHFNDGTDTCFCSLHQNMPNYMRMADIDEKYISSDNQQRLQKIYELQKEDERTASMFSRRMKNMIMTISYRECSQTTLETFINSVEHIFSDIRNHFNNQPVTFISNKTGRYVKCRCEIKDFEISIKDNDLIFYPTNDDARTIMEYLSLTD